jgi:four helix bundle protein
LQLEILMPSMGPEEMRARTKAFALRVVKLFRVLPHTPEAQVMGKQLLRSGTSVAANYRAACRGRSRAEFVARIGVVLEEADESVLWLEMLGDSGVMPAEQLQPLLKEAHELTAIFAATRQTTRRS